MFAQYVGAQIWLNLGNTDLKQYGNIYSVELLTGQDPNTKSYPYNPFIEPGLKAARDYLAGIWWTMGIYKALPLTGRRFTEKWLTDLSVNWYKPEQWYIDYKSPNKILK